MRLSVQRLRWVLLAAALLLVAVLAAYIGYGRYRAMSLYSKLLKHSGATITRDSNGVTYSQSLKGRKIFTIRAKSETSLGNGKWALHNAEMLLYSRSVDHPDHIYSSEVDYDENDGVARANGDVLMDLQAPDALAGANHPKPGEDPAAAAAEEAEHVIHVRTSGLVYLNKLGVAATEKLVEFHYGGMECTAIGADFNTNENILRLLSDVQMDGLTHDKPLHVTAIHADIDRTKNVATLAHPVVTSEGRTARSDSGLLDFETDGSIQRVQGFGNVVLSEGTRQITAARLDATLNDDMQLKAAHLFGGVGLIDTDPVRSMQGSASQVDAAFDPKGEPTGMTASGGAHIAMVDRRTNPRGLGRSMEGTQIVAAFAPVTRGPGTKAASQKGKTQGKTQLSEIHAVGAARASGESVVASRAPAKPASGAAKPAAASALGFRNTQVAADDLRVNFVSGPNGQAQPTKLAGLGHTLLQQDAPLGEQETSSGDTLDMAFAAPPQPTQPSGAKDALTVSDAVQNGNVVIHDQAATMANGQPGAVSSGTAHRAVYQDATQKLTLTGDVHWRSDTGLIVAPTVIVNRQTEDAEAEGGVQATLQNAPGSQAAKQTNAQAAAPPKPDAAPGPLTHILAASAQMHHASQLSEFRGTDAQPAKMWQDASQVQAAVLLFDGVKRTFSARPAAGGTLIHAVLVSNPAAPKPGQPARAASVLRVASPKMDYNDLQREATFTGGVTIDGSMGEVRGQRSVVFLSPAEKPNAAAPAKTATQPAAARPPGPGDQPNPFSGSLDRVIVLGDVQMDQPGRKGTGDELLYTAATGNYVLTGTPTKPPLVVDAQQGNVTGTTLLFGDAGSTIVVAGAPGTGKPGSRVRTEMEVRP
jgi:lipopolysaccharide export system protein LptA